MSWIRNTAYNKENEIQAYGQFCGTGTAGTETFCRSLTKIGMFPNDKSKKNHKMRSQLSEQHCASNSKNARFCTNIFICKTNI
jgi:hypothetical protein